MAKKKTSITTHGHKQARNTNKMLNKAVGQKKVLFGDKKIPI
jgi:hypothetical protein